MKREFVFGSVWKNLHAIYFLTKLALRLNDGGREIWIFHKNRSILCKYENRSSLAQSVFIKMLIRIIIAGKISMDFWFDQWSTITELPSPKITVPEAKIWDPLLRPNYIPYAHHGGYWSVCRIVVLLQRPWNFYRGTSPCQFLVDI